MNKTHRKLTGLCFIGLLLINVSCTKTPDACFVTDKGTASTHVNEEIQYDASCSNDATSYSWDFGDGTSSTGITTKHKYLNAGNYSVKLTANNGSKNRSTTQTVSITQ